MANKLTKTLLVGAQGVLWNNGFNYLHSIHCLPLVMCE